MRLIRHFLTAVFVLVLLGVGALAFFLYDPLSRGPHFLRPSQLITAPSNAKVAPAEKPVQETDSPAVAALALRYQPTVVVSAFDRFWPVSLIGLLRTRWHDRGACVYIDGRCAIRNPTAAALSNAGAPDDYIRFPAPVDSVHDTFLSAAADFGISLDLLDLWPHDFTTFNPFASAQVYFYYLAKAPSTAYPGVPHGLISLEYWFYYPLNYFPLIRIPLLALSDPIGSIIGNTDYHQGDLEHVAVLLDPKTKQPRYLWMARHANEGQAYRWHSKSVQWSGDHPTIYAAFGSHASYAHCGIQRRSRTFEFINDYVICIPHATYGFTYSATPLVDLLHTGWACWRGHLGQSAGLHRGQVGFAPYETDAPLSPLLQQENFDIACKVPPGTPRPAPQL